MDCLGIDIHEIRTAALAGRLSIEQLLDIIDKQQQTNRRLNRQIHRLTERLAQYEPEVRREGTDRDAPAEASASQAAGGETASGAYSMDAENKRRQRRKRRKKSPGRRPTELKFAEAERTEDVYPEGVRHADCELVRARAVWRLENGRAVRVGYRLFAGPGGNEPRIPGVTPRCEYGIEILVVLAFLVYCIGMSLDKACAVLGFFCQLPLAKSQADALLRHPEKSGKEDAARIFCDLQHSGRVGRWRGSVGKPCVLTDPFGCRCPSISPTLRFHLPLIEPDVRICRIRLSDKGSTCVRL
jgi:uncharacterized coiled-coil protein SlyX